uniref:Ulp1 protease family, C-terminal catalytic domain containing protein n=1 Tax=Solanum tuberosum TaxID=4113 RepID=M1DMH8_SOLTU
MPIGIQVWLYECNSSIDIQVAKKVDVHIPKLLNWQTVEIKPKYKKLMNTIFNDVNNKVPQPSFAFDIPQKAVPEVSEEAHELPQVSEEAHEMPQVSKEADELPQVSEEAHEHAEEQFTCLVPIQSMDPMNVTTHS